ncbi:radical SAM family heme chaperone HemW [Niveibacterium sp. SC-1]|uniref:radical SAM family heme chaperone HemW n=1 Tax=Niveibacterium sp. SC-1 TaxID=3135646 RepID=UPI00311ED872
MSSSRIIPLVTRPANLPESPALAAPPPLALYVHFPWCVQKCPYCDFNSHAVRGGIPEADYLAALVADVEAALPQVWGRRVQSIFIGGGTPSLISPDGLNRLLEDIRSRLMLAGDCEITLEANPGTVEASHFPEFRAAGVTRLSLGIQSFDDAMLARIGRIHGGAEARRAADLAGQHFETFNLDLMYALPEQSLGAALADVETALSFSPPHLSCYHLTMEPNTAFGAKPPAGLPDEDASADMQEAIEARLAIAGFQHYETSAFARPGHRCRHNLNYWRFGDYLGVGAGAHGKLSSHTGILREMRHKHPNAYMEGAARGDFTQERRSVGVAELPFEFMMNALRLTEGVPTSLFEERTGVPLAAVEATLVAARRDGLLEADAAQLKPTLKGQRFLNELLERFL